MGGSSARRSIRHGEKRALTELERIYEGPLRGLDISAEFFQRLGSEEFAGTPFGRGFALQNQLLDEASAGIRGESQFRLPVDLGIAIGNQAGAALGAAGTAGSPAGALNALNRLTGFSEGVRQNRLSQALQILQQTAGGSIAPSATQFLDVGRQRALTGADIRFRAGLARAEVDQAQSSAIGNVIGTLAGGTIGAATGGFGLLAGAGLAGGLGGAFGGFGLGSGLLPSGLFGGGGGGSRFGQPFQTRAPGYFPSGRPRIPFML